MKTLVCLQPGSFAYRETEKPSMKPGHALLKIRRIGVCGTDLHAFRGTQPYFEYPRVLGHELAGELVDIDGAAGFSIGEVLTFIPYLHCGTCTACRQGKTNCCVNMRVCGVHVDGGMAEYFRVPVTQLVKTPGISMDAIALIEPLSIAAHGVRRAGVSAGERVLVVGAGPIGIATMQMAKLAGASVLAADVNETRLAFCRDTIGVDQVVPVDGIDVAARLRELTGGDMPEVVIDASGSQQAMEQAFGYMAHAGRYVLIGLQKGKISFSHPEFHKREATLMSSRNATRDDFEYVVRMIAAGHINPNVYITHRAEFDEVKDQFPGWLDPANGVIKAMIAMG